MSIFNKILKGKKRTSSDKQVSGEISIETLKKLIPIRNLSDEKLMAFDLSKQAEFLPADVTIFEVGQTANQVYYLLEGTVELDDGNGKSYEISAGTGMANFPLSGGTKPATTAITKTDCYLLAVSQKIMASGQEDFQKKQQLDFPPK